MKYAIVESGGKQYKAVEGGIIEVDRLPVETGAQVDLPRVLLLTEGDDIAVGMPTVADIIVRARVVDHFKGEKAVIFNYRPKKRYRIKTGHRQSFTRLLIEHIGQPGKTAVTKKPVKAAEPQPAAETPKAEKVVKAKKPAKAAEQQPAAETPKAEKVVKAKKPAKAAELKPAIETPKAEKVVKVKKPAKAESAPKSTKSRKTAEK